MFKNLILLNGFLNRDYPNEKYAYVISLKDTGNEKFLKMNPKLKRTEEYSTCRLTDIQFDALKLVAYKIKNNLF